MRMTKDQRDNLSKQIGEECSTGYYLDRLYRMGELMECRDIPNLILAIRQIYNFYGSKPDGMEEQLKELSGMMMLRLKKDFGFSKLQLRRCYWGFYGASTNDYGITPLPSESELK